MRSFVRPVVGIALAFALAGCSHGMSSVAPSEGTIGHAVSTHPSSTAVYFEGAIREDGTGEACARPHGAFAACHALVRLFGGVGPDSGAYGANDLESAYGVPQRQRSGQTVAIVDAFDDPNAEADLGVYRSHYNLPPCTTSDGCFRKVNQAGQPSPLPVTNAGWAVEISLDLDMVSAICPTCHILLVEGNSNSFQSLAFSENTAARLYADAINNSYGGGENNGFPFDKYYDHPGIMITASAGDSGFGVAFPADSQYVTAVGGTNLMRASNARGWTETVWPGTGGGCSNISPKPSWQTDPDCPWRMENDVSAVAGTFPGVAVYDTFDNPGFISVGGTSVAAPITAAEYGLAGNGSSITYGSYSYSHTKDLHDITQGSNGTCHFFYYCNAQKGYDGPTGNGTPKGIGAY